MIVADEANLHTFADALRFIGDNPGFLATKALEQLELSGARSAISIAARRSRSARRSWGVRCRASF